MDGRYESGMVRGLDEWGGMIVVHTVRGLDEKGFRGLGNRGMRCDWMSMRGD